MSLVRAVSSADWAPTSQSYAVFEDLSAGADAQFQELQRVIDTELEAFVALLRQLQVLAIVT